MTHRNGHHSLLSVCLMYINKNPANDMALRTTWPGPLSFIICHFFFKIITTLSISINAPYSVCYSMGFYIGTLAANCMKTKA